MATLSDAILRGTHSARPSDNAALTEGRLYYETDTNELFRDNGSSWDSVEGAGPGSSQALFTVEGTLTTGAKPLRIYNKTGTSKVISQVFLAGNTAPATQAIIVDIHKNGTTIFTNQAHRPEIAASANTGYTTTIDVATWADGDYLTLEIDQIGTGTVGADLTVHVVYS